MTGVWKTKDYKFNLWNQFFEVVVEYYSEHKNTASIVNSTIYKDTIQLGNWLGRQTKVVL